MLIERVAGFVRGQSDESFEELALAVFRFQYERLAALRASCDRQGVTPEQVSCWQEVPAMPIAALADSSEAKTDDGADRDLQRDLFGAVIDHSLPTACLDGMGRPPVLSLIPPHDGAAEGSPEWGSSRAAEHVLRAWADPGSAVAMARRGVEMAKARSFLGARQRDRRPTLILATPTTLAQLLDLLDRRALKFRLPAGSRVLVTGGGAPVGAGLLASLAEGLAVAPESVVREYGAGGMASRFYAGYGRRGEPRPFRPPPWARVRILDPRTGAEAAPGSTGSISVFDLAGLDSVAHLLTGDVGVASENGFRLAAAEAAPTA